MVSERKGLDEPLLVSYLTKHPKRKRSQTEVVKSNVKVALSPKLFRRDEFKSKADEAVEWSTRFLDKPISQIEAKNNWPERYNPKEEERKRIANLLKKTKKDGVHEEMIVQAKHHFTRVIVDERFIYELNDDAHVQSDVEDEPYICKIVELFQGIDGNCYFTAQWFYRAVDTVIEALHDRLIDKKRVFYSEIRDTNAVCTLRKKLKIEMISLNETITPIGKCDYFCNMKYLIPFSTFEALPPSTMISSRASSTISTDSEVNGGDAIMSDVDEEACQTKPSKRADATLLDLYSGCGAMSTGLTMGTELAGLKLVTKWAVDKNEHACKSMQHNHPETRVRQGEAEDYYFLLIEWEKLCVYFSLTKGLYSEEGANPYGLTNAVDDEANEGTGESDTEVAGEIFQVEKLLDICFGDPKGINERGLYFKVRWLGYGSSHDTWEPIDGLKNCKDMIQEFVELGHKSNILPLPGGVDVVCGGPPCQGISGHNRFRNSEKPLADTRNEQLKVYMNIVEFLKPKYVLMENVVDMLKFANGYMARYAVARLIQMSYQTRMGMMAAGAYGLAQYRMRYFLWGARSNEALPQFPLPTHDVEKRGGTPVAFACNLVAYEKGHTVSLAPKLLLKDIISDLPKVKNSENRDEMPYGKAPKTPFQEFIRLSKNASSSKSTEQVLYNHIPLNLKKYDILRVQQIPKRKGACFRDLRGVRVGPNNVVEWDPNVERVYLAPGHPLVPPYAMSYRDGKSLKPFGRLWWDETVSTVVTRAEPHNQIILHPEQDRVLTIRENARLQGFPDHYKLFGPTKQKYCQVGNAVAVPVAKALGFALGKAFKGLSNSDPLMILPKGFPVLNEEFLSESSSENSS